MNSLYLQLITPPVIKVPDFDQDFWRTWTRFLAYLDQIFGPDFDQDLYSVQFYWDGEIQCTVPQGRRTYKTYQKPIKTLLCIRVLT